MEERAPYHVPARKSPRNLAPHLAASLRELGFTATEHTHPGAVTVLAYWLGPQRERFELTYAWQSGPAPSATAWLTVRYPGQPQAEALVAPQHIRRLRDARQLLLSNVRFANARTLATLRHPLAPAS